LPSDKKTVARIVLVGIGLPVIFLGSGWLFLSTVDGWPGVVLWMLVALPLCFLVEFLLRQRRAQPRSAKSLPRMQVRTPFRGDPDRVRPSGRMAEPDFPWHRERTDKRRRRTHAGR
jgi:hypothetical protein